MANLKPIDPSDPWLTRLQVLGRAQARYLWILFVTGIFFLALHTEVREGIEEPSISAPFLGVALSAEVLGAAGPAVLAYLVLVIMGSLRAYSRARDNVGLGALDHSAEPYDSAPNALDLAAYTTPESKRWVTTLLYFKYPLFLSLFLAEAVAIEIELARTDGVVATVLYLIGAILLALATGQVTWMWALRGKRVLKERRGKRAAVT